MRGAEHEPGLPKHSPSKVVQVQVTVLLYYCITVLPVSTPYTGLWTSARLATGLGPTPLVTQSYPSTRNKTDWGDFCRCDMM
jgi:hypothetical protein